MRVLFIIQGEGRGHMTQALSLQHLLHAAGHEVAHVLVGRSRHREVPPFFLRRIETPVTFFQSPNFVSDRRGKSISLSRSIAYNLRHARAHLQGLRVLDDHVQAIWPDVIVNFYDVLAGLYAAYYKPSVPVVCVGHQYLFLHPQFTFPEGRRVQRWFLKRFTAWTAMRADATLALSFSPLPDVPQRRLHVIPPLLRPDVLRRRPRTSGRPVEPYLLAYLLNSGYADELMAWHRRRPDVRLHCFWDRKGAPEMEEVDETLTFHQLNDRKFLDLMAGASGYASTAGFESICEALYFGLPIFAVPVRGHFEQACNALDASKAGAATVGTHFDLSPLHASPTAPNASTPLFRAWIDAAGRDVVEVLEELISTPDVRERIAARVGEGEGTRVRRPDVRG